MTGPTRVMPRALTSFGATVHGDSLYTLGGYFGRPHAYSKEGQSGDLMRLDLETGQWHRVGFIDPSQSIALVAHNDRLIRIGGMQARNEAGQDADLRSLAVVEAFDPKTASWTSLPSLPSPRSSHDAVVIGDTAWVVGGWAMGGDTTRWHTTAASLDLTSGTPTWTEIEAPFKRRALAVAGTRQHLVVIGGMDDARNVSQRVDVYDVQAKSWSLGPEFPGPGFGVAAVSVDDAVFASGMDGVVLRWAPGQPQWQEVSTLAYPRFFHRLVATSPDELLAVGGIRGMASGTRVRPIEPIPTHAPTSPSLLQFEIESPLPTKNRQGLALIDDTVFMFGGNKSLGQHDFGPEFFADTGYAFDLAAMAWRPIAPYPQARQTMTTFVTRWGHVVSVGGFGHDGEVARSHPEIYAYHPKKDEWRPVGALPGQGRTQFGLAVHHDEALLFGGLDYDPRRSSGDQFRHELGLLKSTLKPTELGFSSTELSLTEPRRAFAGARVGDDYFMVGGMREGFALVDSCEAFSLTKRTWRTFACPSHTRLSGRMVAMGGKLYLAAGSANGEDGKLAPDPSLEVYDPSIDRWTTVADALPIEPKHVHMVAYGDRLALLSTHNERGALDVLLVDPR